MKKITQKHLQSKVDYLNKITGGNPESYTRTDGKLSANVGNYHVSCAYGGVSLHRMANTSGGIRDVFSCGHVPKRELCGLIDAYVRGLESAQDVCAPYFGNYVYKESTI